MVRIFFIVAILTGAVATFSIPAYGSVTTPRYALVIGTNVPSNKDVEPLQYADDDAAKNTRLLLDIGAEVILLTRFDRESRRMYPGLTPRPPTKNAVSDAMKTFNNRMALDLKRGYAPELYIFYSGHGDVENNQGFVYLSDGKLYRKDLLNMLHQSRAVQNHVIVDACKSFFLIFNRGPGGKRQRIKGLLQSDDIALPDNTGVILSTSSARDSHEWEGFQSGIFSHEVRSAMRGAADINTDGKISYLEAASFIWTANAAIVNRRYRPDFFSRPPEGKLGTPAILVDIRSAKGSRLHVGPGESGQGYVEDEHGLRLADFHPGTNQKLILLLPSRRPLFVKHSKSGSEVEIPRGGVIRLAQLPRLQPRTASRGAEHVAWQKLFCRPFNPFAIKNYENRVPQTLRADRNVPDMNRFRRALLYGALSTGFTGIAMNGLAAVEQQKRTASSSGVEIHRINQRTTTFMSAATVCYIIAGTTFSAWLVWTLLRNKRTRRMKMNPTISLGGSMRMTVAF